MVSALGEMELELEGLGELETEFEQEQEAELEAELEAEQEWHETEFEHEAEFEAELEQEALGEISPVTRVYPDAMMEHLVHAAMEAETEYEAAEGFLPLIPMVASKLLPLAAKALPGVAGKLLPRVAHVVSRVTPHLTHGVGHMTRVLHRNPQTRPLLRAVPSIARRAVTTIARHAAAGRPVTPQRAAHILAHQRRRVLNNPRILGPVLRRSRMMDGRYHRMAGIHPRLPGYRHHAAGLRHRVPGIHHPMTGLRHHQMAGHPAALRAARRRRLGLAGHPGIGGRPCPTCGITTMHGGRHGRGCTVVVVR
jgi:hypothetical protein